MATKPPDDPRARTWATSPRYRDAMSVAGDPLAFALQLQLCHYSRRKQYAIEISNIIRQFDLTRFDAPAGKGGAR